MVRPCALPIKLKPKVLPTIERRGAMMTIPKHPKNTQRTLNGKAASSENLSPGETMYTSIQDIGDQMAINPPLPPPVPAEAPQFGNVNGATCGLVGVETIICTYNYSIIFHSIPQYSIIFHAVPYSYFFDHFDNGTCAGFCGVYTVS